MYVCMYVYIQFMNINKLYIHMYSIHTYEKKKKMF